MKSPSVTVSIVSHGHGQFVKNLLTQLSSLAGKNIAKVILTFNLPEPDLDGWISSQSWTFSVDFIKNKTPLGFGENHNNAFALCDTLYFCIVNPDVEIKNNLLSSLLKSFDKKQVGCVYPLQTNGSSISVDKIREIPTPLALLRRYLWIKEESRKTARDWVNGSFILFQSKAFSDLNGFDSGYFMYCEDVDICLRLQLMGYVLQCDHGAEIIHLEQRKSHYNLVHFYWHIKSLIKLWNSASYLKYRSDSRKN